MSSDLISGKTFSPADAKLAASKAAYLATLLLTDQPQIASFSMDKDVIAQLKAHQFPKQWGILDRLKGNAETYRYWCKIMELLREPKKVLK